MKTPSLILIAVLSLSGAAAHAQSQSGWFWCANKDGSKCPPPPVPPAPPQPPVPPMPPTPPGAPDIPLPPPPPAPPELPKIPDGAHAACASAKVGTHVTWKIGKGEVMKGSCEMENGKMVFSLDSYTVTR